MLVANFILIKYKDWKVFIVFAIGNGMYAYYWMVQREWATLLLVLAFLFQNIYGIISWKKGK
jgi:hypothetical protein